MILVVILEKLQNYEKQNANMGKLIQTTIKPAHDK